MAIIINIESSARTTSVAVTRDGEVTFHIESDPDMKAAELLAPYVERCFADLTRRGEKPDAVAVSSGPGSYTGLRIGMSLAKGVCFAREIPLIGIPTLKLLAVRAMFTFSDFQGDELIVPMIDARRMEVYTAIYDSSLNEVMPQQPLILDPDSYGSYLGGRRAIFVGDAVAKAKEVVAYPDAIWRDGGPLALHMGPLAERAYMQGDFLDTAYSTPEYLKDYVAAKPTPML